MIFAGFFRFKLFETLFLFGNLNKTAMRTLTLALLATGLLTVSSINAQDKCPVNFDKISPSDFELPGNIPDTSYGAIILADVGKSSFEGNNKGFFSLIYKHQRRVKIINSKAFDLATVKIPLYKSTQSDAEELLDGLKASTYNLVNGKIEETKLNKDDVFREVLDRKHVVKKFTMPAVKEGSIIDISYTIKSDFLFNLQPWTFQGGYPRLWSEYQLNLPEFFQYLFLSKGKHPFHIKESKEKFHGYTVRVPSSNQASGSDDLISLSSNNSISRWVMKDVPVLREEPFTTSMNNHISKIEFQMAGQQFPNMAYRDIMGTWQKAKEEMLKDPQFAGTLEETHGWANELLAGLNLQGKTNLEKAKAIYYYVQKNIKSLGVGGYELSQPLKQTFTSRKGYVPDVNMLLVLLLKKSGLSASSILLSSTDNGMVNPEYPLLHQYNYLIAGLSEGNQRYYLDASKPGLGFNKLPAETYNGTMVVMDAMVSFPKIYPDDISETKVTAVKLSNDPTDKSKWTAKLESNLGYYESLDIREEIAEKGKEEYQKKITGSYTGDFSADKVELKHLDDFEKPISISYEIHIDQAEDANLVYFNPMLKEGLKENFFQSSERKYPVELPFLIDESYNIVMNVPEGYVIEEVPQSARVSLNETEGSFEYLITKDEKSVALQTRLKINKTFFDNEEYEALRGFIGYVVKKHAEQIVFKKKP